MKELEIVLECLCFLLSFLFFLKTFFFFGWDGLSFKSLMFTFSRKLFIITSSLGSQDSSFIICYRWTSMWPLILKWPVNLQLHSWNEVIRWSKFNTINICHFSWSAKITKPNTTSTTQPLKYILVKSFHKVDSRKWIFAERKIFGFAKIRPCDS